MEILLRIGQVCNLYGISLDTLRYYDRKGLLNPIVDNENGYRYYSLEHLDILEMLLVGKYLEIPLERIKEKIDGERIDGYLDMMEEQSKIIEEKLERLINLQQYTRDMSDILGEIRNFENDTTFENEAEAKVLDVTIYAVALSQFIRKLENSGIEGIEAFEQWYNYNVDEAGRITENAMNVGLSIRHHVSKANELSRKMDSMAGEGVVSKLQLSGEYRHLRFWGKEADLQKYLQLLCGHFKLRNTIITIKFPFSLLHNDLQHEYFAEIYFSDSR